MTHPDSADDPSAPVRPITEPATAEARSVDGPVVEVAIIDVRDGTQDQFADAYRGARAILTGTEGVRSVRMTHGVERPSRFVLLVEWDSIEAHQRNFRSTERWERWRAAIGSFFAQPPLVEHYTDVDPPSGD